MTNQTKPDIVQKQWEDSEHMHQHDDDDGFDGKWPKPSSPPSSDELPFKLKLARAARNYPFVSTPLIKLLAEHLGPSPTKSECESVIDMAKELYYDDKIERDAAEAIVLEVSLVGADELILFMRGDLQSKLRTAAAQLVNHWHLYRP